MKNSKSCYFRLLVGVMTFNQQRKCILAAEKNFIFSIKTLSLCFFLERFFLFFNLDCQNLATLGFDNCPISENEKSLAEKATSALSFSTSEEVFSSYQEHIFPIRASLVAPKNCFESQGKNLCSRMILSHNLMHEHDGTIAQQGRRNWVCRDGGHHLNILML